MAWQEQPGPKCPCCSTEPKPYTRSNQTVDRRRRILSPTHPPHLPVPVGGREGSRGDPPDNTAGCASSQGPDWQDWPGGACMVKKRGGGQPRCCLKQGGLPYSLLPKPPRTFLHPPRQGSGPGLGLGLGLCLHDVREPSGREASHPLPSLVRVWLARERGGGRGQSPPRGDRVRPSTCSSRRLSSWCHTGGLRCKTAPSRRSCTRCPSSPAPFTCVPRQAQGQREPCTFLLPESPAQPSAFVLSLSL